MNAIAEQEALRELTGNGSVEVRVSKPDPVIILRRTDLFDVSWEPSPQPAAIDAGVLVRRTVLSVTGAQSDYDRAKIAAKIREAA